MFSRLYGLLLLGTKLVFVLPEEHKRVRQDWSSVKTLSTGVVIVGPTNTDQLEILLIIPEGLFSFTSHPAFKVLSVFVPNVFQRSVYGDKADSTHKKKPPNKALAAQEN